MLVDIRRVLLNAGVPAEIAAVLRQYGGTSEQVLRYAIIVVLELLEGGSREHSRAAVSLAAVGTVAALRRSMDAYRQVRMGAC